VQSLVFTPRHAHQVLDRVVLTISVYVMNNMSRWDETPVGLPTSAMNETWLAFTVARTRVPMTAAERAATRPTMPIPQLPATWAHLHTQSMQTTLDSLATYVMRARQFVCTFPGDIASGNFVNR
jgi:hypothetical protein